MIKNKKNILLIVGIICLIISSICLVSYSTREIDEVIIKSMTPIYDEESTVLVENTNVTFNDKDQTVKYNIIVENTQNYDVKITDLQFTTPTEEFLKYTVKNVELDDVIKANETKELVISFETVKMDGWGRNFNDELVTTLVFDKIKKSQEVVTPPVEDTNTNENVPTNKVENNNSVNNVQPEVNVPTNQTPSVEEPKEEVNNDVVTTPEDDANHELGMGGTIIVEDVHHEDTIVVFCFGIATGVLGIGLVMVNKNKFTKYIVVFILVGSSVRLAQADEVIDLSIPINVNYKSQNVMKKAYTLGENDVKEYHDYWEYKSSLNTFYIENEISEIPEYAYKFDVSDKQNGRVIAYLVANKDDANYYDVHLQADGIIYPNSDASNYFSSMGYLREIINMSGFDTSNVTNMSGMFSMTGYQCEGFTLDVSSFDTSNVTDMSDMFYNNPRSKSTVFEIDVSNFDTSSVTNMSGMFQGLGMKNTAFTLDVSNFDTSNVTDMSNMFNRTGSSNPHFTLDVSNFDTSSVTNMSGMFSYLGGSNTEFTLDLSNFDTRNVSDMSKMFSYVGSSTTTLNLDISSFDTSNVTNMSGMFANIAQNNPTFTLDVTHFDTSNVTNMSSMFSWAVRSNPTFTLDVSNFDTSNVTNMGSMFYKTGEMSTKFTLDVSNFDTSKVTNMGFMFSHAGYSNPTFTLDVSNFDTSKVTNMDSMFSHAGYNSTEFTLNLGAFDMSSVTTLGCMFMSTGYNSTKLKAAITLKNPNVTDYQYMFNGTIHGADLNDSTVASRFLVNYTNETSELVDQILTTKTNFRVVKGILSVNIDNISIGDEIVVLEEKFNVISQTEDSVTMLAQNGLNFKYYSPPYVQHYGGKYVPFSYSNGWEYTPGSKEIDMQLYGGETKEMLNSYVNYLQNELNDSSITANLISLKELENLGCTIPVDYSNTSDQGEYTCVNSPHADWLVNGQRWWTRSAVSTNESEVWTLHYEGKLENANALDESKSVRPIITISKKTLNVG